MKKQGNNLPELADTHIENDKESQDFEDIHVGQAEDNKNNSTAGQDDEKSMGRSSIRSSKTSVTEHYKQFYGGGGDEDPQITLGQANKKQ